MLDPRQPPPADYYARRLRQLIDGVEGQYSDLLSNRERDVMRRIQGLGGDGIRLLARLWTRTGPVYRIDSLAYSEVGDLHGALHELSDARLIDLDGACPADQLLERLTRVELGECFVARPRELKSGWINRICGTYPDSLIRARVAQQHSWCTLACDDVLARYGLLFFGGNGNGLSTFVLEDLGVVTYEGYAVDRRTRQFDSAEHLDRYLAISDLRAWARRLERRWAHQQAQDIVEMLWFAEPDRIVEQRRVRLLNGLGRQAERAKDFDLALTAYRRAGRPPARERRVRILRRLGDEDRAQAVARSIATAPLTATERLFADGFGRRQARLHEDVLVLASPPQTSVEDAALAHLVVGDGIGRHLENRLPLGMLGLAFWDDVFAPVPGAFVNAYQDRPLDLYWPDFREARDASIARRLALYQCKDQLRTDVARIFRDRHGVSNALVHWGALDEHVILRLLSDVPAGHWCTMFDYMLDDLQQARTGFPDLVVLHGPDRYEFVEVKGPGDQIRPEQRIWFDFFRRHTLPARVLRVSW